MVPLVCGIVVTVVLMGLALFGVLFLVTLEGWKRFIGIVPLAYVVGVVILVVLALMEG